MRALEKDPWRDVLTDYPVGTQVQGTVSRVQPFGAFIELAPWIDGLAHISELEAGRRINHPQEVVSVGDQVQTRVLSVDMEKHRIGLSLDKKHEGEQSARPEVNVADYVKPKWSPGTFGSTQGEAEKTEIRADGSKVYQRKPKMKKLLILIGLLLLLQPE
ncbi:MAG: S1 RNA-binding domain-containing protein [Lysobacterales bacterium]|jgi:small subunit ribosomal protein S1